MAATNFGSRELIDLQVNPDLFTNDGFEWPTCLPKLSELPPRPPPLPVMLVWAMDPKVLGNKAVSDELCKQSLRSARERIIRRTQGDLHAYIAEERIDWWDFDRAFVCRVRGCKSYGTDFEEMAQLEEHFAAKAHTIEELEEFEPVSVHYGPFGLQKIRFVAPPADAGDGKLAHPQEPAPKPHDSSFDGDFMVQNSRDGKEMGWSWQVKRPLVSW